MYCCQKCGYDLTGHTGGVCPECGTDPRVPGEPAAWRYVAWSQGIIGLWLFLLIWVGCFYNVTNLGEPVLHIWLVVLCAGNIHLIVRCRRFRRILRLPLSGFWGACASCRTLFGLSMVLVAIWYSHR